MDFEGAINDYQLAVIIKDCFALLVLLKENFYFYFYAIKWKADYFEGEEQTSAANGCLLKIALFSAQLEVFYFVVFRKYFLKK